MPTAVAEWMTAVFLPGAHTSWDGGGDSTVQVAYLRTENRENCDNDDRDEHENERIFHQSLPALVIFCSHAFSAEWIHDHLLCHSNKKPDRLIGLVSQTIRPGAAQPAHSLAENVGE